ncbi:MAG: type II toxin-antitoxin system PemK/MazF family toxin [Treponema sp.]|nr:type II toxin-antitoxin system PemK/MazF family toxin [Treponema sp.]
MIPQIGHEKKGRRPALAVGNEVFTNFSNLAIVCPITNTMKNYPFHIELLVSLKLNKSNITSAFLGDNLK